SIGMLRDPLNREVRTITFSPDGNSIVSTTADEVKIWNAEPRTQAVVIEAEQEWVLPTISPDGRWLVTAATIATRDYPQSQRAKVWDLTPRKLKFYLAHESKQALVPAFSPDGKLFALGSEGPVVGLWETALWDNVTSRALPFAYLTNDFEAGSICFSPDGRIL